MRQASSNLKTSWQGHWICQCLVSCWDGQNTTVVNLQINLVIFSLLLSIHWSTFSSFPSVLWEDKGWGSRNTNCSSEVLINKICLVKFSPPAALKLKHFNSQDWQYLQLAGYGKVRCVKLWILKIGKIWKVRCVELWSVQWGPEASLRERFLAGKVSTQTHRAFTQTQKTHRLTDTEAHRLTDTETQL